MTANLPQMPPPDLLVMGELQSAIYGWTMIKVQEYAKQAICEERQRCIELCKRNRMPHSTTCDMEVYNKAIDDCIFDIDNNN